MVKEVLKELPAIEEIKGNVTMNLAATNQSMIIVDRISFWRGTGCEQRWVRKEQERAIL
jgi:hypothetical protein